MTAAIALALLLAQEPPVPADEVSPIWSVPVGHAAGLLVGMRLGAWALWPGDYSPQPLDRRLSQYERAWTSAPEFRRDRRLVESDGDPWLINIVGHGLYGAEIYGRVRQCHGAIWQAAAFTVGTGLVWEYGLEAFHKRPSAVDLVLTPVIGVAVGEGRYRLQRWLRTRPRSWLRRAVEVVIDPLGEGERVVLGTRC